MYVKNSGGLVEFDPSKTLIMSNDSSYWPRNLVKSRGSGFYQQLNSGELNKALFDKLTSEILKIINKN